MSKTKQKLPDVAEPLFDDKWNEARVRELIAGGDYDLNQLGRRMQTWIGDLERERSAARESRAHRVNVTILVVCVLTLAASVAALLRTW